MHTLKERFIEALRLQGHKQVPSTSHKFVKFDAGHRNVVTNREMYYWVGAAGALRYGSTIAGSTPVSDKKRNELLALAPPASARIPLASSF